MDKADMMELGTRLLDMVLDVETGKEVLSALETNEERMALKEKLASCPALVASEVFDAVHQITNGRFTKEFVPARRAKQEYFKDSTDENLMKLLKFLYEDYVWTLYTWDLTQEEENAFRNAKEGDVIHIDTPRFPGLFEKPHGGRVFIPAYTSELEIRKERMKEFDRQQIDFRNLVNVMRVFREQLGRDAVIVVDPDSDDEVEITEEMILRYEQLSGEEFSDVKE